MWTRESSRIMWTCEYSLVHGPVSQVGLTRDHDQSVESIRVDLQVEPVKEAVAIELFANRGNLPVGSCQVFNNSLQQSTPSC